MNRVDKAKIRTATVIFLEKHHRATSKQIQDFIVQHRIPLIGDGATNPQIITHILKESPKGWGLGYERDNRNRCIWFLKGEDRE